jgi:hypothetical protein
MARFTSPDGVGPQGPQGVPGNGTPTDTYDKVYATNNGNGTNFKVGDDAWIGDVNTSNHLSIKGVQDATKGGIILGSGKTEKIVSNANDMTLSANNDIILNPGSTYAYIGTPELDGGNRIATLDNVAIPGTYNPNFTDVSGTVAGFTQSGNYTRIGNMLFFCISVNWNGYTNLGTGQYKFTLPFPARQTFRTASGTLHNVSADSKYRIAGIVDTDESTTVCKLYYNGTTTDLAWKYSTPVSWANNTSHFDISGFYEIAS